MKDHVGQWFKIYRELKEPADIIFKIDNNEVIYPHESGDGSSALFKIASENNWQIKNLAVNKHRPIGLFRYFYNCCLFLYWTRPQKNIWPFEIEKNQTDNTPIYATHSFSRAETEALKQKAKNLNVSMTSLLLHSLNNNLNIYFKSHSRKLWWIPVNMRPDLNLDLNNILTNKNYVSNITICVNKASSITDFHNLISKGLKKQHHWATWWWQQLGRYLPDWILLEIAKYNLSKQSYIGTFSNLGEWSCSTSSHVNFIVPPLLSHPIAAGALIWNDQLNLSIRIYPTMPLDVKILSAAWVNALVAEIRK